MTLVTGSLAVMLLAAGGMLLATGWGRGTHPRPVRTPTCQESPTVPAQAAFGIGSAIRCGTP